MPDYNPTLSLPHCQHKALEKIAKARGISVEEFLSRQIESIIEADRRWITLCVPLEVARDLLEDYGEQWAGTNKYDALYECLKEEVERRDF